MSQAVTDAAIGGRFTVSDVAKQVISQCLDRTPMWRMKT